MSHRDLVQDIMWNFGSPLFNCEISGLRVGWQIEIPIPFEDVFQRKMYGDLAELLHIIREHGAIFTAQNIIVEGRLPNIETKQVHLVLNLATREVIDAENAPWKSIRKEGQPLFTVNVVRSSEAELLISLFNPPSSLL